MKLWSLCPREDLKEDNPWEPWFDKAFGFVVRAEDEESARKLADARAGDENRGWAGNVRVEQHPWLDSKYSSCEELTIEGPAKTILRAFASA